MWELSNLTFYSSLVALLNLSLSIFWTSPLSIFPDTHRISNTLPFFLTLKESKSILSSRPWHLLFCTVKPSSLRSSHGLLTLISHVAQMSPVQRGHPSLTILYKIYSLSTHYPSPDLFSICHLSHSLMGIYLFSILLEIQAIRDIILT